MISHSLITNKNILGKTLNCQNKMCASERLRVLCLWTVLSAGKETDLHLDTKGLLRNTVHKVDTDHVDPVIPVPLGRGAGETAPAVCVETPGCDAVEEEQWRASRSHSTGCLIGCRPRYFPSCSPCRPEGIEPCGKYKIFTTLFTIKHFQQ